MQEKNSGKDTVLATFNIEGEFYGKNCFPGLNDLLHEAERHPMAYNRMKKQMQNIVILSFRKALGGFRTDKRVRFDIVWGEKIKGPKRDYDNIVSAGRKIINDALVKAQVIKDDSPTYLGYGLNKFMYVEEPFITVKIVVDEV